eukprot:IDg20524t1
MELSFLTGIPNLARSAATLKCAAAWSLRYAARVVVEDSWAMKLESEPSGVGVNQAYPSSHNGLRYL